MRRARGHARDQALLHEHLAKDDLIAWGWNCRRVEHVHISDGVGTQARLGELIQAWIGHRGPVSLKLVPDRSERSNSFVMFET
jgi:hypothetical protein